MTDERNEEFVERLMEEARNYNAPPETPRDAMWARIEAARSARADSSHGKVIRPAFRLRRGMVTAAAVAALVVISFAVGRHYAPPTAPEVATQVDETTPRRTDDRTRNLYRLAAVPVLDRAEVLLTQFQHGSAENGEKDTYASRAAELMVDTRYLMSSPAGDDPELAGLLGDLELVLAQILRYAADGGHDREFIDESMEDHLLLPRLRATPGYSSGWGYGAYGSYRKVES